MDNNSIEQKIQILETERLTAIAGRKMIIDLQIRALNNAIYKRDEHKGEGYQEKLI